MSNIRSYIEDYLKNEGYKLQQFSRIADINVGTLSAIIRGTRLISMNQLDQITSAMGLEQGYFYEMYGVECFIESAPHWRRLEPFLYRCAELGKLDIIQQVITHVTDNQSYIDELFNVAESLYNKNMNETALILYECVAASEKYQHSERLALCQYRIFSLHKTLRKYDNLNAAVKFEPYIDKLNEEVQLDAIKDLANIYCAIHLWDKVDAWSRELERKAEFQLKMQSRRRKNKRRLTAYPLLTYTAYANLLIASVYDARKEYENVLKYTEKYMEIVEVENPTEEDQQIIDLFRIWGEGNQYASQLMLGQDNVIHRYLDYIEKNPEEILAGFINILQAANQYSFNIDYALDRFKDQINLFNTDMHFKGGYNEQMLNHGYQDFYYELGYYQMKQRNYLLGIDALLMCLDLSSSSKDDLMCIKCLDLYGEYRSEANETQIRKYKNVVEKLSLPTF
ncbi:helix-turn-helix domain-containing protein [Paenibacillus silvae]|uniref:helix-turn-helix domain-containing protein n=1 Tax=Paenibacillus silvae TaxID=1325358 RepID=UPI002005D98E|nr:helix-turn-helix transcriptional regulator [Paenibacillus silvae]MCK6077072.1 helix-turn-helix transcriptional regulator [Paenibacillus silvae]MCK6151270.1 helix-turn-helix transcriptional regulator [Paenibacillus silvae]MCK6269758.1 helix-turn-helix transcriptional regulator [Paenibacillus silvae]